VLVAQQPGRAQVPANALTFFNNYFLPGGEYVVAGVGLEGAGVGGIATGSINIAGVPGDAQVVAAVLYAQVISANGPEAALPGASFRGVPLITAGVPLGKVLDPAGSAPCWSSGGGTGQGGVKRTYNYRFDVLRTFPVNEEGSPDVNGTHIVQLPDKGSANSTPRALGASLVVIYARPDSMAPLNAVVIYDGSYTMNNST